MEIVPENKVVRKVAEQEHRFTLGHYPLACVDLVVVGHTPEPSFLLIQRTEPPCKDIFWLPGGRIFKNEGLETAAMRKLQEELGIHARPNLVRQLGAFDFSSREARYDDIPQGFHAIGICYALSFQERPTITLDDTARDYMWVTGKTLDETNGTLHPYIREVITASNIFKR